MVPRSTPRHAGHFLLLNSLHFHYTRLLMAAWHIQDQNWRVIYCPSEILYLVVPPCLLCHPWFPTLPFHRSWTGQYSYIYISNMSSTPSKDYNLYFLTSKLRTFKVKHIEDRCCWSKNIVKTKSASNASSLHPGTRDLFSPKWAQQEWPFRSSLCASSNFCTLLANIGTVLWHSSMKPRGPYVIAELSLHIITHNVNFLSSQINWKQPMASRPKTF